jgi:hypothetical protein
LLVNLFQGLHDFVTSCAASPFVAPTCRAAMYMYLQSLAALSSMWRAGNLTIKQQAAQPFHLRQKAHLCQHLVEETIPAFGSPSLYWCYRDEDFVGVVKNIAGKTKLPKTLERRCIQKLRILSCLE